MKNQRWVFRFNDIFPNNSLRSKNHNVLATVSSSADEKSSASQISSEHQAYCTAGEKLGSALEKGHNGLLDQKLPHQGHPATTETQTERILGPHQPMEGSVSTVDRAVDRGRNFHRDKNILLEISITG